MALRDRIGPFRLAFLEAILRAADARASQKQPLSLDGVPSGTTGVELHEPGAPYGNPVVLTPEQQALVEALVADGLAIQHKFRPEPLYKLTGKGHYEAGTIEEIRRLKSNLNAERKP